MNTAQTLLIPFKEYFYDSTLRHPNDCSIKTFNPYIINREIERLRNNNIDCMKRKMTYIDLFSGSGGFSLGFDMAGFSNIFSVEYDKEICPTYKYNFPEHNLLECDITKLTNEEIRELIKDKKVDVVIGGPPCQGFSMAGNIGRQFVDDPRNHLFKEFVRVVELVKPKCFVMENVARLYTRLNGDTRREIIQCFEEIGYQVEARVVCAADYGVPQNRHRVLFIGRQKGNALNTIYFPEKLIGKPKTVKEAIGHYPVLKSGESSSIPNHEAMVHSEQMLEKMSYVKDGGGREDIPVEIRPEKGDVRKYIRYNSNQPSICITGDMRKVFHYEQNRALTVRELAAIQTYPDEFIFLGNKSVQQQMVGNSVPPLLAKSIAEAVKKMI